MNGHALVGIYQQTLKSLINITTGGLTMQKFHFNGHAFGICKQTLSFTKQFMGDGLVQTSLLHFIYLVIVCFQSYPLVKFVIYS